MIQFRLRDLFAFVLVAGIVVAWMFSATNGISATKLLEAKKISMAAPRPSSTIDSRPIVDEQLIEILGLSEWIESPDWMGMTGSPMYFDRGMPLDVNVSWLDTPVQFHWEWKEDPNDWRPTYHVVWTADWDAIEKRQRLTQIQSTMRVVLTGVGVVFLVWLYIPRKKRQDESSPLFESEGSA